MLSCTRDRGRKRAHSGGWENEHSEKRVIPELTSDPETVNARIFVGSITADVTREKLLDHFSRWGKVVGVSVTKNKFGFIQFNNEKAAQDCLASGYMTIMDGIKLDVKPAKIGPGQSGNASAGSNASNWSGRGRGASSKFGADRSTTFEGTQDSSPRRDFDSFYNRSKSSRGQDSYNNEYSADFYRDYYNRSYPSEGNPPNPPPRPSSTDNSSTSRTGGLDSIYYESYDPLDYSRPNDVEIVVPNKLQRSYAERIEGQLKRMSLLVDLLFPPPNVSPSKVLSDLTERRCLYAIFVTGENEKHNSLTLNILHGETQEHRNMPIEEAFRFIQHNFEEYVKKSRQRNAREVVPRDIRNLVLDLLEMKPLSMGDLDKLIKYLRERQNSLVDDQIEQKRETAGNQTAAIRNMAITYPGYSYLTATSVAGAPPANHTNVAAHPAIIPAAATPAPAGTVIVSTANPVAAVAAAVPGATYQAATYAGLPGITYGIQAAAAPAPLGQAILAPGADTKHNELQERILNLMKGQSALQQAPTAVPTPAVVPTAVPPPTGVPAPRLLSDWASKTDQSKTIQSPQQQSYNPWSQ